MFGFTPRKFQVYDNRFQLVDVTVDVTNQGVTIAYEQGGKVLISPPQLTMTPNQARLMANALIDTCNFHRANPNSWHQRALDKVARRREARSHGD